MYDLNEGDKRIGENYDQNYRAHFDVPMLADCAKECQKWFKHTPDGFAEAAHQLWHENRDEFARASLDYPFRRWYERASVIEVERFHADDRRDWRIEFRCRQVFELMFGHSFLYGIALRAVMRLRAARKARGIARRIAEMQRQGN
jgi:hypothetical protein